MRRHSCSIREKTTSGERNNMKKLILIVPIVAAVLFAIGCNKDEAKAPVAQQEPPPTRAPGGGPALATIDEDK